jgi:hypothetical protein
MWTPRWIARDPARVVDEIQSYVETLGARNFPFQGLTAIVQREWIVVFGMRYGSAVCELLGSANLAPDAGPSITKQPPS